VDDLTKLTGPELAAIIRSAWVVNEGTPPLSEALRRLEEDDRVAMRNIERERDLLREALSRSHGIADRLTAEIKRWREWAEGVRCDVGTDDDAMDAIGIRCATLNRIEVILGVEDSDEEGAGYEALRKVVSERDTLRAEISANRRVLLEDVNKAHRENDQLRARLEAEANKPIPVVKLEAGDAYVADLLRDLDHWKSKALGTHVNASKRCAQELREVLNGKR
jgi:hypothetical protein